MGYNQEPDASQILAFMQQARDFEQPAPSGEGGIMYESQSGEGGMPVYSEPTYYENLQRFSNNEPSQDFIQMQEITLGL